MNDTEKNLSREESSKHGIVYRCVILFFLVFFTTVIFFLSIRYGAVDIGFKQIIRSILSAGKAENSAIIWHVRLPRTIIACLAGASLAVSGAILQTVLRNPLASPGIIGISSGAGLGATIAIIAVPLYFDYLVPAAFFGALITSILIYLLAWRGGLQPLHLILSGVAIASLLSAITNSLMIIYPDRVHGTLNFMIGSLSGLSWKHVHICMPYSIAGIMIAIILSKRINVLSLGDDIASSLGVNVEITRLILMIISALLAASAVSIVGLLGFVGLIAPHMMRLLIGSDHRFLVPASVIFSSGLLMLSDLAGRLIARPIEVPAGIIMAILGAPFFLYLLRRKQK